MSNNNVKRNIKKSLEESKEMLESKVKFVFDMSEEVLKSNNQSNQNCMEAYKQQLKLIHEERMQNDISEERKKELDNKEIYYLNLMSEKDSENKQFLQKVLRLGLTAVGLGVAVVNSDAAKDVFTAGSKVIKNIA